jgi:hypothetical protein
MSRYILKLLLVFLLVFFFNLPLFAQSVDTAWVRRYDDTGNGDDRATGLVLDSAGNVYLSGYCEQNKSGNINTDFVTIKYYPNGDTAWIRSYAGKENSDDYAEALAVDDYGNAYVTGASGANSDAGSYSSYVTIKYLSNGDTAWARHFSQDTIEKNLSAYAIEVDNCGNVYVTGTGATIGYNTDGNCLWIDSSDYVGQDITIDDSGYVCVTGYSKEDGTYYDYVTMKYYPDGDTVWVRRYNGPGNGDDRACAVVVDGSGKVYVTGLSLSPGTSYDYATVKYYSNGDICWVRRYNGPADEWEQASALAVDDSGNVYVTGFSQGIGTSHDYATIKYYSNGDTAWARRYNGAESSSDRAWDIAIDDLGNSYVTGYSSGTESSGDYATIKYSPKGEQLWVERYNGSDNSSDNPSVIAVDKFKNVYVTGWSNGSETSKDYATIKYVQFLRGDADNNGYLSLSDVVYLINYLFKLGSAPHPLQSGDTNCDGKVSLSDVVYLKAYLLKKGPPPCR